jgi:hypothetical protein
MSQITNFTNNTTGNSLLPHYQEKKPDNISIDIIGYIEPKYYTMSGAGLPLFIIDSKKKDKTLSKPQLVSNYIENIISNNSNNELSNALTESVTTIKILVGEIIGSTDNEKIKNQEFGLCAHDYCDAV